MTSLDGLGLHMFGCQQLVFQGCDVGDALLLESLKPSVKGFLWLSEIKTIMLRCNVTTNDHIILYFICNVTPV